MKISVLLPLLIALTAAGQTMPNPDFEMVQDTNRLLPQAWQLDRNPSISITLDSVVVKSGRRALLIASVPDTARGGGGFSQNFPVHFSQPTLVHLRGFIKTDNPAGVGIWWNSWQDSKHRGFAHSDQQLKLRQTQEWQPLDLVLATPADVNKYSMGAYFQGRGRVWFDDLRLESVPIGAGEPSAPVKAYLQKVVALVKKHALVSDSIPWPQTHAELLAFTWGMQTEQEVYPIIIHLLRVMRQYGDNHSSFLPPSTVKEFESPEWDDKSPQPQARYLGDGVGYVAVPSFLGIHNKRKTAFARQIQQLIAGLDTTQTVMSWVVDLRQNEGGNMGPMIAGLGPLLGEGTLGYFVKGKHQAAWGYRNGIVYLKKTAHSAWTSVPAPYRLRQAGTRVAVLIGPLTASSGEMTAISFMGRANTRFFGLPTGGYTTSNQHYELADGAFLFIASSISSDRLGRQYLHKLVPDEQIKKASTEISDPTLEAAKIWLLKNKGQNQ